MVTERVRRAAVAGVRRLGAALALAAAMWMAALTAAPAGDALFPDAGVFALPDLHTAQAVAAQTLEAGEIADAAARLDALIARAPRAPFAHALRAVAHALADEPGAALAALRRAAALGAPNIARVAALPAFDAVRAQPDGAAALAALKPGTPPTPRRAAPPDPQPGAAVVGEATATFDPGSGLFDVAPVTSPAPGRRRGPAIDPREDSDFARLLRAARRRGAAAGHAGDLYDNRDRGHSIFRRARFPQVDAVVYDADARAAGVDYGLNDRLRFDAIVFGNSSTAVSDPRIARSLPRLAMTRPGVMARLAALYEANHVYVYPEHRDHDPGRGDLFPANAPFFLVSQGSSGSDRPLLDAVATILAALRPDAKAFLRDRGLIAPTVQMVFRRAMAGSDAAYLTGPAHPSAFDGAAVDLIAMARLAGAIAPGAAPGAATLRARRVDGGPAIAAPGMLADATLFETPYASAQAARDLSVRRRYVLDAGDTTDPNGRTLRFVWRVLRGGEDVTLRPRAPGAATAELVVDWPDVRGHAPGRPDLATDRVEIAVFADNGVHVSAPAFFSVVFPGRQRRTVDAGGRLTSVDHADPARAAAPQDPLIFAPRDWRDDFAFDADGALLGWTRRRGAARERFTRFGGRVLETDELGRPVLSERVETVTQADAVGRLSVTVAPTGERFRHVYADDEDRLGALRPASP